MDLAPGAEDRRDESRAFVFALGVAPVRRRRRAGKRSDRGRRDRVGRDSAFDAAIGDAVDRDGRPTGVHDVTAILPAPLSNAPRGVVVFGRDGSAATVWTGARDEARRDARGHADATAFFLDANQGDDANVSTRTPPLAPVNHLARIAKDDDTSRATSAAMIAGGRAFRLTRGVATTATTASPPCFRDVTAMWTLGEDAIALSHADATSVFVALKPGESNFEEAIDGAGLATNEPAIACGAWWSGNVVASWTQITPRRARLCADGAILSDWRPDRDAKCIGAAVVSSSGRAAASLPARGVVVILRRVGDALIETARVLVDAEPSCLEMPPPRVAAALVRAMRATESCDDAFEDEDECVLLSGTYARALEVTAIREKDSRSGSDSLGTKSAPLLARPSRSTTTRARRRRFASRRATRRDPRFW